MSTLAERLNAELADTVLAARRSLVRISSGPGAGAGIIVRPEGIILTNAHVIGHGAIQATLADGRTLPARLLARDPDLDLAALAVDAGGLPAIEIGDSKQLRPGQWVLALGHPWGIVGAVTAGVVTNVGTQAADLLPSRREWVTVSLELRPGYSGGPLVDADGRLVGLNTIMAGLGVGLAVPTQAITEFLREKLRAAA